MALENKGLTQIRTYDKNKMAVDFADVTGAAVGVVGGLGTALFMLDLSGNLDFQPAWTPGYELNHDGIHQVEELGYLLGYLGSTGLGVMAARAGVKRVVKAAQDLIYRANGENRKDAEFNASYQTLADKLLSGEPVPEKLHPDYKDSLQLDLLTHYLSQNSVEGEAIAKDISRRRAGLVTAVVKEHLTKLDYEPAAVNPYLQFLAVQDLLDLGNHYVELGHLNQAETFITDHLKKFEDGGDGFVVKSHTLIMREKLAEEFYKAGQLSDAERIWTLVGNKEKLRILPAAYRNAGDEANAARVFAEHWQE